MVTYRQGAVAGDHYKIIVLTGNSGLNMSTVTSVAIKVENPDGSEQTWTTGLSGVTTTQLTATYQFTSTSPFPTPGDYRAHCVLTYPSGTMFSEEAIIRVLAAHEVQ